MLLAPRASVASLHRFLRVSQHRRFFCTKSGTENENVVENTEAEAEKIETVAVEQDASSIEPETESPIKPFPQLNVPKEVFLKQDASSTEPETESPIKPFPQLNVPKEIFLKPGQVGFVEGKMVFDVEHDNSNDWKWVNLDLSSGGSTADPKITKLQMDIKSNASRNRKRRSGRPVVLHKKSLSQRDQEWGTLAKRAEDFLGLTSKFMEDLDVLVAECCELQEKNPSVEKSMALDRFGGVRKHVADANKGDDNAPEAAIRKTFEKVQGVFQDIYRDHLLCDIQDSNVIQESGDQDYFRVAVYKIVLGDMLAREAEENPNGFNDFESESRKAAISLKKVLRSLAKSIPMPEINTNKEGNEAWNLILKKFQNLELEHKKLNKECLDIVNGYEATKKKYDPDNPRNLFEVGNLVNYYLPALKKWTSATILESKNGPEEPTKLSKEEKKEGKPGKLKLEYEREYTQNGETKIIKKTKWISKWHSNVQPLADDREKYLDPSPMEVGAITLCSWLQAVKYDIPVEAPLRLPQFYHEIDDIAYPKLLFDQNAQTADTIPSNGNKYHLMQKYYLDQYLPDSHPARLRYQDKTCGRDPYRDRFIQREKDSSRIFNSEIRFDYYHRRQHLLGGDQPMLNFFYLTQYKNHDDFRLAIPKSSSGRFGKHKENYDMFIFHKYGNNFKVTSNRTLDMFNARGFDLKYSTERLL